MRLRGDSGERFFSKGTRARCLTCLLLVAFVMNPKPTACSALPVFSQLHYPISPRSKRLTLYRPVCDWRSLPGQGGKRKPLLVYKVLLGTLMLKPQSGKRRIHTSAEARYYRLASPPGEVTEKSLGTPLVQNSLAMRPRCHDMMSLHGLVGGI